MRSRQAETNSAYYSQRHLKATLHRTYESTRHWNGKRSPQDPGLLTVWTTRNDFTSPATECGRNGCKISTSSACTVCLAPAFVTSQPKTVRKHAEHAFKEKFNTRKHLPKHRTHHAQTNGVRVCHLRETIPEPAPEEPPAYRSIQDLLHPRHTSQATKSHYADIMTPPSYKEFTEFLSLQKGNSAPGPSKFRYCMLLRGPETLKRSLFHIVRMCIHLKSLPKELKAANLLPIPKTKGARILALCRPITLAEIGMKLVTGLLAHRLRNLAASAPSPLWHHNQYGGSGGTHAALLRFLATLEDADEIDDPNLIMCLADVKAAYDSVSTDSKAIAYRRAGLPEDFIQFAYDLDSNATTSVLVPGFEPAEPFTYKCGIRQGCPLSVLTWLIFLNPAIDWIEDGLPPTAHPHSYTLNPDSPQASHNGTHPRHDNPPVAGAYQLRHQGGKTGSLYFMDDAGFLPITRLALTTYLERFSIIIIIIIY